jgi:hypothetical protein
MVGETVATHDLKAKEMRSLKQGSSASLISSIRKAVVK